jgi:hypothetical protein
VPPHHFPPAHVAESGLDTRQFPSAGHPCSGAQRPPWLVAVAWLPAYAPELHPVEQLWDHTKYSEPANDLPDDLEEWHEAVGFSLASKRYHPTLLRSRFRYAKLKL